MGQLTRRFTMSMLCFISVAASSDAPLLRVQTLAMPGAMEIVNQSAVPVSIQTDVVVERLRDGHWIDTPVTFQAVESCDVAVQRCVVLAPGGHLKPITWDGHSCSGQCARSCRSNHYNGPGDFRFAVTTCDHAQTVRSDAFHLGPETR